MKILLADDDINKRERIISFIDSSFKENKIEITEKKSYQSSLECILNEEFDLILLDMTMPTYDISIEENGERVKVFAGKEIMRKMVRRHRLIPVVVMTQFETFGDDDITFQELENELKTSYKDIFLEIIYYHNGLSGWQVKLLNNINKIFELENNK